MYVKPGQGQLGKLGPQPLHRWQPQLAEHDRQACGLGGRDVDGAVHAASSSSSYSFAEGKITSTCGISAARGAKRARKTSMSGNSPRS